MSSDDGRSKVVFVLALFAVILLLTYFWPIPLHLADLRGLSPEPLRGYLDNSLEKYPPEERAGLVIPPPEIVVELNGTLNDPVVTRGELNATPWIEGNTTSSDRFVADIFGAELIMGMTTRTSTEGGDWANAPNPLKMMGDTNEIYKTTDSGKAHDLARGLNATYVFLPEHRRLNTGWWVNASEVEKGKFNDTRYFEKAYGNEDVSIFKVL